MHRRNVLSATPAYGKWVAFVAAGLVLLLGCEMSRASVVVSAQSVTTTPGASNVALDVTLTNTGPGAVNIGAFAVELKVASTDISFTNMTTGTTLAYIFGADSLFGPGIAVQPPNLPGQDIKGSDVDGSASGQVTIGGGGTVGLAHVLFNVGPSANGQYVVNFVTTDTNLSDVSATDVPITTLNSGTITVLGTAAPTPTAVLGGSVLFCFLGIVAIRRRRSPVAAEA